ncbi:MAG: NADH-quinone oxidoreductase subunit N [Bacteroidia bacterium]|nr:NADH-quinone oxidoreductase subunit N [Bacteroidia bacterium]
MKELLLISGLGVLSLLSGIINFRKGFLFLVIIGLLANIGFSIMDWNSNENVYDMMLMDNFALAFNASFSVIAILWFISANSYFDNENNFSDHFAMVLFSLCGGLVLVSFSNMTMLFLGIEILSIPLFVLVGSDKTKLSSNEAAFKYFLLGAFASAFLLFGIALIYGSTGSFKNETIATVLSSGDISPMALIGMLFMMVAMSFKVSAAPFHFWAPDVYQGAPSYITALMATVVKTVAFAAFYRLFSTTFMSMQFEYKILFSIAAALTMLISNITAAVQSNVKRMLAYSSISHAGFMMITLLCMSSGTSGILYFYTLVYSISSIAAFTIFEIVRTNSNESEEFDAFKGLSQRSPLLAIVASFALLSMSGIPPLSGFFAKYLVFTAAVENGYLWLAVVGIIASLIAVYYYFKLITAMFGQSSDGNKIEVHVAHKFVLIICALALIFLSLFPNLIIGVLS